MPFLRRALGAEQARSARRLPSLGARSTASSVSVDPERSLQIGAVYSCVRLLSEAVASLPVAMFERRDETRVPLPSHPLLALVRDRPNPVIDAGELWRTVMGWMLLRGNAYVFVERDRAGRPKGLWPVSPTSVEVQRAGSGQLVYQVDLQDAEWAPIPARKVRAENMLHYRAFGLGVEGLSPIGLARQSVGIAFAAQSYMGGFYARDASPGGRVEVPGTLTDDQYERLVAQWKSMHEGFDKAHQLAVMEGGAKWEATTLNPSDAQFIETQKFSRSEIASIYGVPPHMIGDTEKSTSWGSGIAEQGIGFVTYSLRPWLNRLERVTARLIAEPAYRLRWNVDGLMEGDTKARYDAYSVGKQWGWLSTNDIRRREDLPPVDDGDAYLQPLNMVPAGSVLPPAQRQQRTHRAQQVEAPDVPPAQALESFVQRHRDLLVQVFEDQREDVLAALQNGAAELDRDVWDARLADLLFAHSSPVVDDMASRVAAELGGSYVSAWTQAYLADAAMRQAVDLNISTGNDVRRALDTAAESEEDPAAHLNASFDEASSVRAPLVAAAIVNRLGNFGRHEGAYQSGARTKTWRTTSRNPRPEHARLNGETVAIDQRFSNRAMWPHDPSAGADQVAGCKCTVEFSTEESS